MNCKSLHLALVRRQIHQGTDKGADANAIDLVAGADVNAVDEAPLLPPAPPQLEEPESAPVVYVPVEKGTVFVAQTPTMSHTELARRFLIKTLVMSKTEPTPQKQCTAM